ncbi:MAG: tRNA (guanosine(37)-N1)-methyltransferase TrmD [Candidatus Buchananbacteria bacterium]
MINFKLITIFPNILDSYFSQTILARAQKNKLIKIDYLNLRGFTTDKHKTVDDKIYGGGAGMLLKIEPIYKALRALKSKIKNQKLPASTRGAHRREAGKLRIILLAANGKQFEQSDAKRLSKYQNLIFICGRYEGVDARVEKFVDEKISIGPYVLAGGELGAAVMVEAISRLIPGVVGKIASVQEESFSQKNILEHPHYTRPELFITKEGKKLRVPKALLSGHHGKIGAWRQVKSKKLTTKP